MVFQPLRFAVVVVVSLVVAGCQPAVSTPVPVPSYRCTPEAGGAQFDCSQRQFDEMMAKDQLYAEAEAVYRRFLVEDLRIAQAGGATEPTDVLRETASGFFLKDALAGYRSDKERGMRARGGTREVKSVTRLVGVSKGGSVVALRVCTDSTSVSIYRANKRVGRGVINLDDLYFAFLDSRLVIIGVDGVQVDRCESV